MTVPAAEPAKGQLDSLVKNSPFGSSATARTPGTESSLVEFRGMFVDQGEQFFSFYEAGSNTSQWVGLKETGTPFTIEGYDSSTQTVKVTYRNQPLTLTLKRAQIVVQAMPTPTTFPVTSPPATGTGQPAPAVRGANPGEEAARLALVAEEIRRRRALRSQPAGGPPPPQAVPANSPRTTPLPPPTRP